MSEFKVAVNNESDFNAVLNSAVQMGYYNDLEFKYIPNVKVLFLSSDSKHIQWSRRGIENYKNEKYCKEVSIEELEKIAAGHRIDKSPLMQHLDECAEVVKTWPKWKQQSIRDALGIPVVCNDLGDDSHIENHISPHCKVEDA